MTFLLEYLKDQKTEDQCLQYIICQQSQSMYWFHYMFLSKDHFLFCLTDWKAQKLLNVKCL